MLETVFLIQHWIDMGLRFNITSLTHPYTWVVVPVSFDSLVTRMIVTEMSPSELWSPVVLVHRPWSDN